MFHRAEEQLLPMNLSEARRQDYVFAVTGGRLVFRTPYGQRDAIRTEVRVTELIIGQRCSNVFEAECKASPLQVNGVPVEMVHATLFSRQSWVVLMVDMMAACSVCQYGFILHGRLLGFNFGIGN